MRSGGLLLKSLAVLALMTLVGVARPALAQEHTASYSTWSLSGDTFIVRFLLPVVDANRLAGSDVQVLVTDRVGKYLLGHLAVSADGHDCPAIDQGFDIGKVDPLTVQTGMYGFEIFFRCASAAPRAIVLHDSALFGVLPGQIDFARVQLKGGPISEQLFTANHQTLRLADQGPVHSAGMFRYFGLGAGHMFGAFDRWACLVGLWLLARRRSALRPLIAGLASGYAVSLLAALPADLVSSSGLLEAGMGFLVMLLAMLLIVRASGRLRAAALGGCGLLAALTLAALFRHAGQAALVSAGGALFAGGLLVFTGRGTDDSAALGLLGGVFGFIDGSVLPALLVPLHLSAAMRAPMVVGFDLGALWVAALVLVALQLAGEAYGIWRARRMQARTVRLAGGSVAAVDARASLPLDLAIACLTGLGLFWLVSRLPL